MQPTGEAISTCPTCGGVLEETPGGGLGCMSCLLRAGIGSEEEMAQDSNPNAFAGGGRFGVYEIDCHADGSFCELGRGAMGITYRATDTSLQRKVALTSARWQLSPRLIIGSDLNSSRGRRCCWFPPSSLSSAINVSSPASGTLCWRYNPTKQRSNRQEPTNYKKIAGNEFSLAPSVIEPSSNLIRRAS